MRRLDLATVRKRGQGDPHLLADPTYGRRFIRRISPVITWVVVNYTPLSADAVTLLAIASGIAGGLLTAVPGLATNVAAVCLLQIAYLLDVADGEVARVRRTSGRRGTYLDLIGHVLQNRALYGGAAFTLMVATDHAPWAIALGLAGVAFASPFGEQARMHVLGVRPDAAGSTHGRLDHPQLSAASTGGARIYWAYRRVAFLWNYPASMNLFCVALLADAIRYATGSVDPLIMPAFAAAFAGTLTLKQLANAVRILSRTEWTTST